MKIDESAEEAVVLLSQYGGIGFRVFNQIGIVDVGLNGFHIDGLQLTVCDGLRYSVTVVCKYFQISNNRKWSEMASDGDTDNALHLLEKIMTSREWPWTWVGKLTCWFRSKDSKIPVSCITSDDEDSRWTLNHASTPDHEAVRLGRPVNPATHQRKKRKDQVVDKYWEYWGKPDDIQVCQIYIRNWIGKAG